MSIGIMPCAVVGTEAAGHRDVVPVVQASGALAGTAPALLLALGQERVRLLRVQEVPFIYQNKQTTTIRNSFLTKGNVKI